MGRDIDRRVGGYCVTNKILRSIKVKAFYCILKMLQASAYWLYLVFLTLMSVVKAEYDCSLSMHGKIQGCVGIPLTELLMENSYRAPILFSDLQIGGTHACAIRYNTGQVVCWKIDSVPAPEKIGSNTGPADAPNFIFNAKSLSLGLHYSCAL